MRPGVRRPLSVGAGGIAAAGLLALPIPLPSPLPPVLPLPSASLPAVLATPSVPVSLSTVAPASPVPGGGAVATPGPTVSSPAPAGSPGRSSGGVTIPFTTISVSSPLDVALLAALATLPLLLGIWLLVFGRTVVEARRARDAQDRLALAADLGLRPKDLAQMSTAALFELREKAAFDELTGCLRRAAGISLTDREIARARRHKTVLTVAFVDIDGLRATNERAGPAAGDSVLQELAKMLKAGLRDEDVVFRYGGDEFVGVLPETDGRAARLALGAIQAEAARRGIRFCHGVAELDRQDDVVSVFARADQDLYEFKSRRGEIVHLPPASPTPTDGERAGTA